MGRVRTYRFEVVNKVKQWEELAKQAQERPQKILLRRMPGSAKKGNRSENRGKELRYQLQEKTAEERRQ
jgi:diaminopimelate decarboxylase